VRTLLPTPDEARETEGAALASALQPGAGRFLPFAQLPSALRQMRQSAPTRYQQVSQQIAAHLEGAAQTARSQGAPAPAQSPPPATHPPSPPAFRYPLAKLARAPYTRSSMGKLALFLMGALAAHAVTIHGAVVDSKTHEPLGKALVSIRSQHIEATTGDDGRFELPGVQPGTVELFVSTVNYGLLKEAVEVPPGADMQLEIELGQGVLKRSEHITVTAGQTTTVSGSLTRSVDSTGWIAADLHMHTANSIDSAVLPEERVVQLAGPVPHDDSWKYEKIPGGHRYTSAAGSVTISTS